MGVGGLVFLGLGYGVLGSGFSGLGLRVGSLRSWAFGVYGVGFSGLEFRDSDSRLGALSLLQFTALRN